MVLVPPSCLPWPEYSTPKNSAEATPWQVLQFEDVETGEIQVECPVEPIFLVAVTNPPVVYTVWQLEQSAPAATPTCPGEGVLVVASGVTTFVTP